MNRDNILGMQDYVKIAVSAEEKWRINQKLAALGATGQSVGHDALMRWLHGDEAGPCSVCRMPPTTDRRRRSGG